MTDEAPAVLVLADDDPDDFYLTQRALEAVGRPYRLDRVGNGRELLEYLRRRGPFEWMREERMPSLVLLDLNMPVQDGRAALREIKDDPDLRRLPVVVLTTSQAPADVAMAYELGASSFVHKPPTFTELVRVLRGLTAYWLDTVARPTGD